MNRISEFYAEILKDEALKKQMEEILGGKKFEEASDEQLVRIGEIAGKLGYNITLEAAKEYFHPSQDELDDGDLEAVAGGKGVYVSYESPQDGIYVKETKVAKW